MRLIDADMVIDFMNKVSFVDTDETFVDNGGCLISVEELEKFIQDNAMEEVEPDVHAHWIEDGDDNFDFPVHFYLCSKCGVAAAKEYPYCPCCDAKMDEDVKE